MPPLMQGPGFTLLTNITKVQTIAAGLSVRDRARLRRSYGRGRWRKVKGFATVQLDDGTIWFVELHWYEAHGIGKKEIKVKNYIYERSRPQ